MNDTRHPIIVEKGKKYRDVTSDYIDCGIEYGGKTHETYNRVFEDEIRSIESADNRIGKRVPSHK